MAKGPDPVHVYEEMIDHLVTDTLPSVAAEWVVKQRKFTNAPATRDKFNPFVASLSLKQRKLLAEMLQDERDGGIHDVLAALTWWIECREVGLTVGGKQVFPPGEAPIGISGVGMHGDYTARRDGWTWPKDPEVGGGMVPPKEPAKEGSRGKRRR
jgi:hypothetical protein